jgi:hypothetical protein
MCTICHVLSYLSAVLTFCGEDPDRSADSMKPKFASHTWYALFFNFCLGVLMMLFCDARVLCVFSWYVKLETYIHAMHLISFIGYSAENVHFIYSI